MVRCPSGSVAWIPWLVCLALSLGAQAATAQTATTDPPPDTTTTARPADANRVHFSVDLLAGYGTDRANSTLGFERQGRIGYAIVTATGNVATRLSYTIAINPVNETSPVPSCGAPGFFYPNDPTFLYGASTNIACDPQFGNRRVDAYRSIALDVVPQQGALREAYIDASLTRNTVFRFGRTRLPIGFDWQEAGAMTAKDALMIQRIDAQALFAFLASYGTGSASHPPRRFSGTIAADVGDTNRWLDYDYFYFEDGSFGTNSQLTFLASGRAALTSFLEVRSSLQFGDTGSKVERRPSYWASKRNDNAATFSLQVKPIDHARVLVETAKYTWGPRASSALMVGADPAPIIKRGYDVTLEGWWPISRTVNVGANAAYERIGRSDSLVRYLADAHLYNVTTGRNDERTVFRTYVDLGPAVRVGFYRTLDSNPFPWISGITAISGPGAMTRTNTNKWGLTARLVAR